MIVSIIAAMGKNRVIGKDNQMMWHLRKEFQYFKQTTLGHSIISGRKNFEAIGSPLPKRKNIIITRNKNYETPEGCFLAHSLEEALAIGQDGDEREVFICGGGEIYSQAINLVDRIYLTEVDYEKEGDVYFPTFDESQFSKELVREESRSDDNEFAWKAFLYTRIKSLNE